MSNSNFQSERLISALLKAEQYQNDQTRIQMRTTQDAAFRKGDVTTNGPARNQSAGAAEAGPRHKWGWH